MTVVLQMPFDCFFNADKKPPAFHDLVAFCLNRRRALTCRISANAVVIDAEQAATTELRLYGTWATPSLSSSAQDDMGAKLILPLLFNAMRMQAPYDQLYTLGHSFRSIADFFTRNLYLAILRDAPIVFTHESIDKAPDQQLRALRRHYFYIIKSEFAENCFQSKTAEDALNAILVNSYLPVLDFANPLLRRGGEALRRSVGRERQIDLATLKAQVLGARAAVMSQFGS